jgi:hypothetical protein
MLNRRISMEASVKTLPTVIDMAGKLSLIGITPLELDMPVYSWLRRHFPNEEGSHLTIEKVGKEIHLKGGIEAYTLDGRKVKSPMEKELEALIPQAPKGFHVLKGDHIGTEEEFPAYTSIFNSEVKVSAPLDHIYARYYGVDPSEVDSRTVTICHAIDPKKPACVKIMGEDNAHVEGTSMEKLNGTYYWLFPNKDKWLPFGVIKTRELLTQLGVELPKELKPRVAKPNAKPQSKAYSKPVFTRVSGDQSLEGAFEKAFGKERLEAILATMRQD